LPTYANKNEKKTPYRIFPLAQTGKKPYLCQLENENATARRLCGRYSVMRLKSDVHIKNRRATFDYVVLDRYVAGIQLFGTEIKSIRESKASLADSYCSFQNGELWVKQMHIAEYRFGSYANHDVKRDRKLLLTKKELRKLERQTKESGKTIIPLVMFINEKGFAKMEIGLCQGKHSYDKRQALQEKETKRELDRMMKR